MCREKSITEMHVEMKLHANNLIMFAVAYLRQMSANQWTKNQCKRAPH